MQTLLPDRRSHGMADLILRSQTSFLKMLSTIADKCEEGLTGKYDQRHYRVSFYLATTRLSRAGPGSDLKHEWHKLKHQVPQRVLRGDHSLKKWPFMFIMTSQWTKKSGKAVSEVKGNMRVLSGHVEAGCLPARVQLRWYKHQSGSGIKVSTWFHVKTENCLLFLTEWMLPCRQSHIA